MEKRICPKCSESAYSSSFDHDYNCPYCGKEIPASLREGETHPAGALSPGETVVAYFDGTVCEKCGCHIVRSVQPTKMIKE